MSSLTSLSAEISFFTLKKQNKTKVRIATNRDLHSTWKCWNVHIAQEWNAVSTTHTVTEEQLTHAINSKFIIIIIIMITIIIYLLLSLSPCLCKLRKHQLSIKQLHSLLSLNVYCGPHPDSGFSGGFWRWEDGLKCPRKELCHPGRDAEHLMNL